MKKRDFYLIWIILLIFLINGVSARITINLSTQEIYNLGDELKVSVTTAPVSNFGNLNVNLDCEKNSINFIKWPIVYFGQQDNYQLPIKILNKEDMELNSSNEIIGNCHITANFGNEQDTTNNFIITRNIIIEASLDKLKYNPGEKIILNVEAKKANGNFFNGFLEVSGATNFDKAVNNGKVSDSFVLPETTESGNYELNLLVYDKDNNGEIMNFGNKSILFSVNQVATSMEIALSSLEAEPGENFKFSTSIYDQSNTQQMNGGVSVSINSLINEAESHTFSLQSENDSSVKIPLNATPGTWKIKASFKEINEEREFRVKSKPKAEFEFIGSILVIKNIGNDIYNKTIEIHIGNETEQIQINLNPGEEKRFNLKAPNGEYTISISDGTDSVKKNLLLTGGTISINDIGALNWFNKYPLIWIFITLGLFCCSGLFLYKYKRRTVKSFEDFDKKNSRKTKKLSLDTKKINMEEAKDELIKSEKTKSSVVCLNLRNFQELKGNAREELNKIFSNYIKGTKGMVDFMGEYVFIVYSPVATKTFENEKIAAKVAFGIFRKLLEHNKKFAEKIIFNIGLNSGDLIASLEDGKLEYTSVGTTILLAKKLANMDKSKMLVSEDMKMKLGREFKFEKLCVLGKKNIYSVEDMQDTSSNKEKLANLLKRTKSD